jgi:phage repressor protein C with HTH and peptisase S24 domain
MSSALTVEQATAEFAKRLKKAVKAAGGNNVVSKASGIGARDLTRYVTGSTQPKADALAALGRACRVSLDWLLLGIASDAQGEASENEFSFIPRLEVEASAGSGAVALDEDVGGLLAFRTEWLRRVGINPGSARALKARGDSMEPTIRDGDILLVDTSIDRVMDEGIYIVVVGGLVLVKRLSVRRDGSLILKSDNGRYEDERIPKAELAELAVSGRVMWFGRAI